MQKDRTPSPGIVSAARDSEARVSVPAGTLARPGAVIGLLAALYTAQGIPFGFATEYLPVVLRESGLSYAAIAALGWLQLPWQLKIFWAKAADHPRFRRHTRLVILVMQLALTAVVAAFAIRPLRSAPALWFALTFVAAAIAATQDVFVDAFAVRVLRPEQRGYGNTAQVAGYRLGILVGGAALLLLVGKLGERMALLTCAGIVASTSIGAFVSRAPAPLAGDAAPRDADAPGGEPPSSPDEPASALGIGALAKHLIGPRAWVVLAIALTFKMGLHMAVAILKPMVVDYGWTKEQIGAAVVTVGSGSALAGAAAGGMLHRVLRERRALAVALVVQALVCAPLVLVDLLHAPLAFTTVVIAVEHFGTGLGTTVLFAALMSATRPADAGLHYTVLTSANALALGVGSVLGGLLADLTSKTTTFVVATLVCLAPSMLVSRWDDAAKASRS